MYVNKTDLLHSDQHALYVCICTVCKLFSVRIRQLMRPEIALGVHSCAGLI